jgi:hypothetical protein
VRALSRFVATTLVGACLATAAAARPAAAQAYYTINGQLAPYDIAMNMAANGLPPGHYWLNAQGFWGVVGYPQPLGRVDMPASQAPRRRSLSERGMLFGPGEIMRGSP